MMRCINVDNVNQGLADGLLHLAWHGIEQPSRNGPVLVAPTPVMTTYASPCNRVLLSAARNANPFFHMMEAVWMLAGRNDIAWPAKFNKKFIAYSDDGVTQPGAYGYRWRRRFGYDQLERLAAELRQNPTTRRAVLAMWDPGSSDLTCDDLDAAMSGSADVPCNTHAYFDMIDGRLNMTVCCRSNDIWWGCYGANAVHFSMLLEYMAAKVDVPVGVYRQLSNNFHIYTDVVPRDAAALEKLSREVREADLYGGYIGSGYRLFTDVESVPMVDEDIADFELDLQNFMKDPNTTFYGTAFFHTVVSPMYAAWEHIQAKRYHEAEDSILLIGDKQWKTACHEWMLRRRAKALAKKES